MNTERKPVDARRAEFECYAAERFHVGGFQVLRTRYIGIGGFVTSGERVDDRVFDTLGEAQAEADRMNAERAALARCGVQS